MTRRGLTLIELLLSLVLLAAILASSAVWVQIAGQVSSPPHAPHLMRLPLSMHAVLELIQDDLVSGDFTAVANPSTPVPPPPRRVQILDGDLVIETRIPEHGAVTHSYRHDPISKRLVRNQRNSTGDLTRPLVDQVKVFECRIDVELAVLEVQIRLNDDRLITRRYPLS